MTIRSISSFLVLPNTRKEEMVRYRDGGISMVEI